LPDPGGRRRAFEPFHSNQLADYERRDTLQRRLAGETERMLAAAPAARNGAALSPAARSSVSRENEIPTPPDLKTHVLRGYDLGEIFEYINPAMLYSKHLGLRNAEQALAAGDPKATELRAAIEAVEELMLARDDIKANAVYRFFRAQSDGDRSVIQYSPDGKSELCRFRFGRQSEPPHLCLADYLAPADSGRADYLCAFIVTIGTGVRALAEDWKNRGDYLRSHILQVLAVEGAEAFAELLHQRIRAMWGIADPPGLSRKDLYQSHYRGKRYSFGYGACPRMEDQTLLFHLLESDRNDIGVRLTEGYMMDPESSVSALVFHHPECKYFNLSPADAQRLEDELRS
jgi:5-methyltetrahydrofolate--homocysteine methyltransferase